MWALMFSVSIVTGLYIPVNISYLLALSPNEILSSDTKAVSWGVSESRDVATGQTFRMGKDNAPCVFRLASDVLLAPFPSGALRRSARLLPDFPSLILLSSQERGSGGLGLAGALRCHTLNIRLCQWDVFQQKPCVLCGCEREGHVVREGVWAGKVLGLQVGCWGCGRGVGAADGVPSPTRSFGV